MDESKIIYTYEKDADSVKPGDTIEVNTPQGNVSVVVGGIVREISEPEDVIAVSEKFLDRIFKENTSEIYNDIVIHTDPNADFEKMEKKMGEFFRKLGKEENLTSEGLVFRQIKEQFVSDMFQKFTIIVVAGLLYILIMYQESIGYFDGERRRIGTFQSLGIFS